MSDTTSCDKKAHRDELRQRLRTKIQGKRADNRHICKNTNIQEELLRRGVDDAGVLTLAGDIASKKPHQMLESLRATLKDCQTKRDASPSPSEEAPPPLSPEEAPPPLSPEEAPPPLSPEEAPPPLSP